MVRSNGDARDDDFERKWEAITEQLADLQGTEVDDDEPAPDDDAPRGDVAQGDDSWGADAPYDMGGPRDYEPAEERFVPPEPEPISAHRPVLIVGWSGLGLGALILLVSAVIGRAFPAIVPQAGGAILLLSFGLLLSQLPKDRGNNDDDDPGGGAVV